MKTCVATPPPATPNHLHIYPPQTHSYTPPKHTPTPPSPPKITHTQECTQVDQQALQDIHLLTTRTAALRCAAHADCCAQELAEKEGVAEKLQGISMQGEGPGAVKGEGSGLGRALQFLADNLDMYVYLVFHVLAGCKWW